MKKQTLFSIVGGLGILVLLFVGLTVYFGSFNTSLSWLNGKPFYISPKHVHLKNREPGTEETVTFHLKNLTSKEISVVGEKSSCSCAFSENLPITAKPKESVELKIRVKLPKDKDYDQTILFMVATSDKLEMSPVRITASILHPISLPAENEAVTMTGTETETESKTDSSQPGQEQTEQEKTVQ